MNKIHKWFCFAVIILVSSCSDEEPDYLTAFEKELVADLEVAYKANDANMLLDFFEEWKQNITPNDANDINDDTIQTIYEIYDAFYRPDEPDYLGEIDPQDMPDSPPTYLVIQHIIQYQIQPDSLLGKTTPDIEIEIIDNFRPRLDQVGPERVLYLTDGYHNAIRQFLGSEFNLAGTNNFVSGSLSKEESTNRGEFLKNHLHLINKWNSGNWTLETHPKVLLIYINEELTKAIVDYNFAYQYGETYLNKTDGEWVITNSEVTSIE